MHSALHSPFLWFWSFSLFGSHMIPIEVSKVKAGRRTCRWMSFKKDYQIITFRFILPFFPIPLLNLIWRRIRFILTHVITEVGLLLGTGCFTDLYTESEIFYSTLVVADCSVLLSGFSHFCSVNPERHLIVKSWTLCCRCKAFITVCFLQY